jgi:hypothetical protein
MKSCNCIGSSANCLDWLNRLGASFNCVAFAIGGSDGVFGHWGARDLLKLLLLFRPARPIMVGARLVIAIWLLAT